MINGYFSRRFAHLLIVFTLGLLYGCGEDGGGPVIPDDDGNGGYVLYVDAGASGSQDGSSWEDAFVHPQDAVDAASPGEQVWVAEGTYHSLDPGTRNIPVLTLKRHVEVYGGFAAGDTGFSCRDYQSRLTVLDGEDGVYHVVVGADDALIDGFTITGGYACCRYPSNVGGGMLNIDVSVAVANCTFSGNRSTWGGGIYNKGSRVGITNCTFEGNRANYDGGGMYNDGEDNPGARPAVTGCIFMNNLAVKSGGGMYNHHCHTDIMDCTFLENRADEDGGGVYNFTSNAVLTDCTFEGNRSENGAGMYNYGLVSPYLEGCLFTRNMAVVNGGGMCSNFSSAVIYNCIFSDNASEAGAGMYISANEQGSSPHVINGFFVGNGAGTFGGGVYVKDSSPSLLNCTLAGNSAKQGGGVTVSGSGSTDIVNCIVWGNWTYFENSQIFNFYGMAPVPRVVFSDVDQDLYGLEPDGEADENGNIRQDPLFVAGPLGYYYLSHLDAGQGLDSPCIDAGGNSAQYFGLDGRTTRTDNEPDTGVVDLGYHFKTE